MSSRKLLRLSDEALGRKIREEALATPFIYLTANNVVRSAWKRRVLLDGYCGLLTYHNGEPSKCMYCHVDLPYDCCFRVKPEKLFYEKLFHNEYRKRVISDTL